MKLAALLVASLAAVGSHAFETVAHRAPPGRGPAAPRVFLAVRSSELGRFLPYLAAADRARVRTVSLPPRAVVAVFRGEVPSGGHSITIRRLEIAGGRLRVVAAVRAPGPDELVTQAITTPYHVVSLARASLGSRLPTAWILRDTRGQLLATGVFPVRPL